MSRQSNGLVLQRAMRFALWAVEIDRTPTAEETMARFDVLLDTAERLRGAWLDLGRPDFPTFLSEVPPCVGEKMADVAHAYYRQEME